MKSYVYWIIGIVAVLFFGAIVLGAKKEHNHKQACIDKDGVWLSRDWVCVSKSSVIQVKP